MRRRDAELVEANERAVLLGFGALELCELGFVPGATLLDSGVGIPAFNGVIATAAEPEDVPEVAAAAAAWFAARGRPWVWRAGAGNAPADLPQRLEALGFVADDSEPGMVCDLGSAPLGDPGGHVVEDVGDDEDAFAEWYGVFAPAFAIPLDLADALRPVVQAAGRPGGPLRHFVLRDGDGRGAVRACGSLADGGGAAGLANIATRPEHRGLGLGHAMTLALLREARAEGHDTAVLSATPEAVGLYRRVGFTETGRRWIYVPPA